MLYVDFNEYTVPFIHKIVFEILKFKESATLADIKIFLGHVHTLLHLS